MEALFASNFPHWYQRLNGKGLIRYCLSQTSSLMCHNSLSEPCPHLVRWLMGISIIGIPIATPLTSFSCFSPLLTSYPKIPPGPNSSVWRKCQTQSGFGVNTHKSVVPADLPHRDPNEDDLDTTSSNIFCCFLLVLSVSIELQSVQKGFHKVRLHKGP